MEPGNATVLVTNDRVDIWIGDQSPQETRFSAAQITGIPEADVYLHMCHLGGGFGRNGNGPQAEQAIMIANANRGTPIHLLWTREEDFIGTTYRAMGVARLRAALDERGAEAGSSATISAMVHTVSVSREGKVKLERVDVAHDKGFGLVNPLSVKKQIEGQITWFYNDAMHQACTIAEGRIVENNFHRFPLSRIDEDPPEINVRFFETGHWLVGMGHD